MSLEPSAAEQAESLPALQRRIGIPLFALVAVLVGLAAGDSVHALLQMRSLAGELGRVAAADASVHASIRAVIHTQMARHAALERVLDATGSGDAPAREERVAAVARFSELGDELASSVRAARERLLRSGWSEAETSRTLQPIAAFEAAERSFDAVARSIIERARDGCDAACEADKRRLADQADGLDLRVYEILEVAALSLDRAADLARVGEEGFLRRSLLVSAAAILTGIVVSAILLRRSLASLRRATLRRERTETALRRSESRLRATLDASIDPIVTIGADGIIRSASRAFGRVFGHEGSDLVGRNVKLLMPEPLQSQHDGYLERYVKTGRATVLGRLREVEALRRDGTTFPCEISINAIDVEAGEEPLFCGVLRDITERKRGEQRLQQYANHLEVANLELADSSKALQDLNAQLRRSNEDLDAFAAVASHDLKEPLRGIHNYARFLIEDYGDRLDAEGASRLDTLARLAARLSTMIDALLEFSRLGRAELDVRRTNLHTVVVEVVESLQVMLLERKAEVRISDALPTVVCSGPLVAEVFRNLIENAVKYNDRPDPRVEIDVRPATGDGRSVPVFTVRDNGIGIRERHFDAVFRLFKRLNGRDQFGQGTGMGLTIVKKIVERHGGRVWVESVVGEGSMFLFTLCREG